MNEWTFNEKVRGMEAKLYHTALSMLRSDADCADAIQNAVFTAWRRLPSLKDEARFEAWLYRILLNACRDIQRQYKRQKNVTALDETCPAQADPPPDLALKEALTRLAEKYRLPVVMHHLNGLSIEETARVLTLPTATVKWRVHEGLKRLRAMLEEEEQ